MNRHGAVCIALATPRFGWLMSVNKGEAGNMGEQMTAIVAEGDRKRLYLSPTNEHIQAAISAEPTWRPTGNLPDQARSISVQIYGFTQWHQLFTTRQLTALTTFGDFLAEVSELVIKDGADKEYANAVCTYLALAIGRNANGGCSFTVWNGPGEKIEGIFSRQAIPMAWDFPEANPFSASTKNWTDLLEGVTRVIERFPINTNSGKAYQADAATTIHAKDGPVIVTDPTLLQQHTLCRLI